ncbi:MAG: choice-of-anchor I family protein [Planctomycetota bacterium]
MQRQVKAAFATGTLAAGLAFGSAAQAQLGLSVIGSYGTGIFDESAAEIPAYDAATQRLFVTNAASGKIDVLDLSDPTMPSKIGEINLAGAPNSVAVNNGLVAVAVEAAVVTDPGQVQFFNAADLTSAGAAVPVGALPDMLTFTPDGSKLLVANEGEPDGGVDPNGSVSIIDTNTFAVATAGFTAFTDANTATTATMGNTPTNAVRRDPGVGTLAADVEPEYIAVSEDSSTAFVTLQEANSVAVIDIATNTVTSIQALGTKNHLLPGNELDASDRDGGVNIDNEPVFGMYMPDAIATYNVSGINYYVTANEGDDRGEDERVKDLDLDSAAFPSAFPGAPEFTDDDQLGRLGVSTWDGDTDGDGDYDQLFAYGSRSFSIFDENGNLVFDSGNDFETITANTSGAVFNSTNDENDSFEGRSENKGPEPEGVTLGVIDGKTYAFIGLERVGGIMVYDVTDPTDVQFEEYINPRDFGIDDGVLKDAVEAAVGTLTADLGSLDLGPEGLLFIAAGDNALGIPLLVVTNEVSGTTTIYAIPEPGTAAALLSVAGLALLRRRKA